MSEKSYKLKQDFRGYDEGKEFVRVKSYGSSHIYIAKLEEKNIGYDADTMEVKEEELFEKFTPT
jgi:hypothetical protein